MILDEKIINAIQLAVANAGGQTAFAACVGTTPQNISKYLNGKVKQIRVESWVELLPHIYEYLPKGYVAAHDPRIKTTTESWVSSFGDEEIPSDALKIELQDRRVSMKSERDDNKIEINLRLTAELIHQWKSMSGVRQEEIANGLIDEIYRQVKEGK